MRTSHGEKVIAGPAAAESQTLARAWEETIVLPSYAVPAADKNPMFLDGRVYQGSNGKAYPNPVTEKVSDEKKDRPYRAVFLENEHIRVMTLPEIGGRVHAAEDKSNAYDFFYRQNAIKPALVGLLGPWISGGLEFNWPQHHRPSTFMAVEHAIERGADGSGTIWLSEHEPMNRMKGMTGIRLYPGKALIEAEVRLYNRTPLVQTFLWWANLGVHVHEGYEIFFPPDVTFVADHAKRAVCRFPLANGRYYGVDYHDVDIRWYKNIPVPTSYMVTQSKYDFMGGYDHKKEAGVVHVAPHQIAPGKKLWTWGNSEFGYAWDRELTDEDGPYVELMSGVYTDNQPDFSFLHPYETRTFRHVWYPIQKIGPVKNANRLAAVNLERNGAELFMGVCLTEAVRGARVVLTVGDRVLLDRKADIAPGAPYLGSCSWNETDSDAALLLRVFSAEGRELIRYRPEREAAAEIGAPATEPPPPEAISSNEELYVTGLHLEQYRHATRSPEPYWREAILRDPQDSRANNALGLRALRRGRFAAAEEHFRRAIERLTVRNPNPYDAEPYYNLGLALKYQRRPDDAYDAFYKATWNYGWQSPALYGLATIECERGNAAEALAHLARSLAVNAAHLKARNLETAIRRRQGETAAAAELARATAKMDPLDFWSQNELVLLGEQDNTAFFEELRDDPQNCLDLAFDYLEAGLCEDAADLLERALARTGSGGQHPMLLYTLGAIRRREGDAARAHQYFKQAASASPDYCFPSRLDEFLALESVIEANPEDGRAHYYLGNLLYDKDRREDALVHWERSCELEAGFATAWRNAGIAVFNVRKDAARAIECYEQALATYAGDSRLLYELDHLRKRAAVSPQERLAALEQRRTLVAERDDLTTALAALYNLTGYHEDALRLLAGRRFHPWEGGEGQVPRQYVAAHVALGIARLAGGRPEEALEHFSAARQYPHNFGEGKHHLTEEVQLDCLSGVALRKLKREDEARAAWERACASAASTPEMMFFRGLALSALGRGSEGAALFRALLESAGQQMNAAVRPDYFATSVPDFLSFDRDLEKENRADCFYALGLALTGLGSKAAASEAFSNARELDRAHLGAALGMLLLEAMAALDLR